MTIPILPVRSSTEGLAPALECPDEALVADARSGLTPSQMVDRKLLALLGSCSQGPFVRSTGRGAQVRSPSGR